MTTNSNPLQDPLFYLVVQNRITHMVSGQRQNAHLATKLPTKFIRNSDDFPFGTNCLKVCRPRPNKPRLLATLGPNPGNDIYIRQNADCQFEISDGGFVMLHDRSPHPVVSFEVNNPEETIPFKESGPRRVVIMPGYNEILHFGEGTKYHIKFQFVWNGTRADYFQFARETVGLPMVCEVSEDPEMVEAIVGGPPSVPATPEDHSPTPSIPRRRSSFGLDLSTDLEDDPPPVESPVSPMQGLFGPLSTALDIEMGEYILDPPEALNHTDFRYVITKRLGSGTFGTVGEVVDMDSGRLLAVKNLKAPSNLLNLGELISYERNRWQALHREVAVLSRTRHPAIVNYVGSRGWEGTSVRIFFGLKKGTLLDLIRGFPRKEPEYPLKIAKKALHHMLLALTFLESHGIVHRDIKPANILFDHVTLQEKGKTLCDPQYMFVLADFGLCNPNPDPRSGGGTHGFCAPELKRGEIQTPKVDIWSLYITILYTMDFKQFRTTFHHIDQFFYQEQVDQEVRRVIEDLPPIDIREMGIRDPRYRASAIQMLSKLGWPHPPVPDIPKLVTWEEWEALREPGGEAAESLRDVKRKGDSLDEPKPKRLDAELHESGNIVK